MTCASADERRVLRSFVTLSTTCPGARGNSWHPRTPHVPAGLAIRYEYGRAALATKICRNPWQHDLPPPYDVCRFDWLHPLWQRSHGLGWQWAGAGTQRVGIGLLTGSVLVEQVEAGCKMIAGGGWGGGRAVGSTSDTRNFWKPTRRRPLSDRAGSGLGRCIWDHDTNPCEQSGYLCNACTWGVVERHLDG